MRLLQLTPGTGDFHCGACLRDETLMRALRARGIDTLMVPLYLPLVIDGDDSIADRPILFGGINVYLEQKSALFRNLPRWMDRWLSARWLLSAVTRFAGMTKASDLGELTLSMLRGEDGRQAKEIERLIHWVRHHFHPDVIVFSNVLLIGMARKLKQAFDCPVVCTLQGEDGFIDSLPETDRAAAWSTLAQRARDIDAFIPVSRYYGQVMRDRLHLDDTRIKPVHNGIALDDYFPAPAPPTRPTIGFFARLCAAKGTDTLARAFVILKKRGRVPNALLRLGGSCNRGDESFVNHVRTILKEAGVMDDVSFHMNLTLAQKQEFMRELSVLSVPATYGESFGLYVIEALACGVPVVQPRHAAFPELIDATGGGILCEPNDPDSLAQTIENLLLDEPLRTQLGQRGRAAVEKSFTDQTMAQGVLDVIHNLRATPDKAPSDTRETANPMPDAQTVAS